MINMYVLCTILIMLQEGHIKMCLHPMVYKLSTANILTF